jgi:hypothetical protein
VANAGGVGLAIHNDDYDNPIISIRTSGGLAKNEAAQPIPVRSRKVESLGFTLE